jgi:competence protein ComFC
MKCRVCGVYSWNIICTSCQTNLLKPELYIDEIGGLKLISFYNYDEIKELLHTKYEPYGSKVFAILASNAFATFVRSFEYPHPLVALPIDDDVDKGYSHTAILARILKSKYIKPHYGKLRAHNDVKYAGRDLEYKLAHPRDFRCSLDGGHEVVLVDDVVTDGVTMKEAVLAVEKSGNQPVLALALSYSKRKHK